MSTPTKVVLAVLIFALLYVGILYLMPGSM